MMSTAGFADTPRGVWRPWAADVSEGRQARALQLYAEGNAEFVQARYTQALVKYQEAIQHWDHPAIRFNMAVSYINLGQFVEARDSIERGLAYGFHPLGQDLYRQALTYRRLLDGRLASLTIICEEKDAEVTLDGKRLFFGPGKVVRVLLPGEHRVVTMKPGFLIDSKSFALAPGADASHEVRLTTVAAATPPLRWRWPRWAPFTLFTLGGVMTGLGIRAYLSSAHTRASFDLRNDAMMGGGAPTRPRSFLDRPAMNLTWVGAGGAALIAGAFMLHFNKPLTSTGPKLVPAIVPIDQGATLLIQRPF